MKKEKTVKTYTRRLKSGKVVTVKQHTAKYDAAEALKEAAKKKGAGVELEELNKKSVASPEELKEYEKLVDFYLSDADESTRKTLKKSMLREFRASKNDKARKELFDDLKDSIKVHNKVKKVDAANKKFAASLKSERDFGFSTSEFAEWYEGTGSKADKKVEKALRKLMGRKAYDELSDNAADNYKKGGANAFFKKNVKKTEKSESPKSKPSKKSDASELSGEKVGGGIAFKDNKAGQAWAKKNGELVAPFGKGGRTYYKVGDDLYGNITGGHGGTIWGKVDASKAKKLIKMADADKTRKEALKNPTTPTSGAEKAKLYKMLTSKSTKLWDVPEKYKGFFSIYGNPNSKGKAFIKEYDTKSAKAEKEKPVKTDGGSGMRSWEIHYNELTPMGTTSSADRTVIVKAKTKRGALGIYKREYHKGYDSAYATTLYDIKPHDE